MPGNIKNVIAAIGYIESRLQEKLDLDTIAEALHYSKYHLHRMFTGTVGLSIQTYAQRRRLTEAAKLLVFSDKPILEIALNAGYESQQSFTGSFRAMYKKAPNQSKALALPKRSCWSSLVTRHSGSYYRNPKAVSVAKYHGKKKRREWSMNETQAEENPLARGFDIKSLLKFAFPTIIMMLFMGLYTIVDTIFVAQFVGTNALSALNIVCPVINLIVGLGTMLATGGSAIVARKMGAGENVRASQDFTLIIGTGALLGVAPVISYNYGKQDNARLKKVFSICMRFIILVSIVIFGLAIAFGSPLVSFFAKKGTSVYEIARKGFLVFPFSFLFWGLNIFASATFTALSNGKLSAVLSFLRTFGLILVFLLILPEFLGVAGVWLAVPIAELITMVVALSFLYHNKDRYHYA